MRIEEKKKALYEMCDRRSLCVGCHLYDYPCYLWASISTENFINEAYSIAFPDTTATDTTPQTKDEHLATVEEIVAKAVENYKAALLKKIFPYDAVDKKQYSINAYAVERAIIETEVHHD